MKRKTPRKNRKNRKSRENRKSRKYGGQTTLHPTLYSSKHDNLNISQLGATTITKTMQNMK